MAHPIELKASQILQNLREGHRPRFSPGGFSLSDDVYFSWDSANGEVTLRVRPLDNGLVRAEARVEGAPEWMTLNISLGQGALSPGDVLGLVVDLDGCPGDMLDVFIRSSQDGDLHDSVLQTPLAGTSERQVQTLLHPIADNDGLTREGAFHTLAFRLPPHDFELDLLALTVFVLPAAQMAAVLKA